MQPRDEELLRRSIQMAERARREGNHPFGAVLADEDGNVFLEAGNTVNTARDVTGHAETNLVREASRRYAPEELEGATMYASTEPCPMCSGAIYWSHIGRVVYALSQGQFYHHVEGTERHGSLELSCREVLGSGARHVEVVGPSMEELAARVHAGFWTA